MNTISQIISTPIISLYESEEQGIVYNLFFDAKNKRCKYLCLLNENENTYKLLKTSNIYKYNEDSIFIKNKTCLNLKESCEMELEDCQPITNLKVYSLNGKVMGITKDAILDDKLSIVSLQLSNNTEITRNEIFNIGKSAIIIDKNKTSISKFKPKENIESTPSQITNIHIQNNKKNNNTNENIKVTTDYRFLLGRTLQNDIKAPNGEIIAHKGSNITKDTITKASMYGKLIEISRYSSKL